MEIKARGILRVKLEPSVPTLFDLCQIKIVEQLGAPQAEKFLLSSPLELKTAEKWVEINRTALSFLIKNELEKAALKRFGYSALGVNCILKITGGMGGYKEAN